YTNFYEFSRYKWCWKYVEKFQPNPWAIHVGGLCRNLLTLDLEELHRRFQAELVERQYRHRCVERWAMAVPWTGIPLAAVLKSAERIELISREPATFWRTLNPAAYPFESNVDPEIPRPWDQSTERMLGSDEQLPTQKYNGYGEWVAGLY